MADVSFLPTHQPLHLEKRRIMQSLSLPNPARFQANNYPMPAVRASNMQRMGARCWRCLINQGVPFKDARELAIAIVHFIYLDSTPSQAQKYLIDQYQQHICAARLSSLQF